MSRTLSKFKQRELTPNFNTINWRHTTHFDSEDDYNEEVVETSVIVNSSPIKEYDHSVDHTSPTYKMPPGFKSFRVLK